MFDRSAHEGCRVAAVHGIGKRLEHRVNAHEIIGNYLVAISTHHAGKALAGLPRSRIQSPLLVRHTAGWNQGRWLDAEVFRWSRRCRRSHRDREAEAPRAQMAKRVQTRTARRRLFTLHSEGEVASSPSPTRSTSRNRSSLRPSLAAGRRSGESEEPDRDWRSRQPELAEIGLSPSEPSRR